MRALWLLAALIGGATIAVVVNASSIGLALGFALLAINLAVLGAVTAPFAISTDTRLTAGELEALSALSERPSRNILPDVLAADELRLSSRRGRYSKRALDSLAALLALIFLAPLLFVISLAIRLESRGPVLQRDRVIGKAGRPFTRFKFRTTPGVAAALGPRRGVDASLSPDVPLFRVNETRVGRFLRRYSLDELPALMNVLRGEMSLVGPPAVPETGSLHELSTLLNLTEPGITGMWRLLEDVHVQTQDVARVEIVYLASRSLWSDVKLSTFGRHEMRRRAIAIMWGLQSQDNPPANDSRTHAKLPS